MRLIFQSYEQIDASVLVGRDPDGERAAIVNFATPLGRVFAQMTDEQIDAVVELVGTITGEFPS